MSAKVIETCVVTSAYVDGLNTVRIDHLGVARVNLYAEQLDATGEVERVLTVRLTMSQDVMREIADRLMTESMVASHTGARAIEERRRKIT